MNFIGSKHAIARRALIVRRQRTRWIVLDDVLRQAPFEQSADQRPRMPSGANMTTSCDLLEKEQKIAPFDIGGRHRRQGFENAPENACDAGARIATDR